MQLIDTNMWMGLPPEIFKLVHRQARSKCLSQVDRRLHGLSARITETIHISPPLDKEHDEYDILVRLIKRYPYVKTLSLGKTNREFSENEIHHLRTFIVYLNTIHPHPLNHIESLTIHEIKGAGIFESKEINRLLMESLGHPNLKSISINVHYEPSILTGREIQPILENSVNLRIFTLNCHSLEHPSIALTFDKLRKLRAAKFIEFCECITTLESVRSCRKLKTLRLIKAHDPIRIKQLLSSTPSTNLIRLSIPGIQIDSDDELDAITQAHPNLEHLNISLGNVTEKGFITIGLNCPNLRSVSFSYKNATDQGVDLFSSKLTFLEELLLTQGNNITGKGIAAIAQNCQSLRLLKMFLIKGFDKPSVEAIAKHCLNLNHLEINYSGPIALEEIRYLALNLKSLNVFKISHISGITEESKEKLIAEFPRLKWV